MATEQAVLQQSSPKKQGIVYLRPTLTRNDLKSVLESLVHDEISFGQVVVNFEKEFASTFEFQRGLSADSLTAAYHLAYLAFETQKGDEVVLPSSASIAALDALSYIGAVPKLIDTDREGFHPSVEQYLAAINENTRAVVIHYSFGSFKDYSLLREKIEQINAQSGKAAKHKIRIIEDISYIAGLEFKGQFVGSDADIAIAGLNEDNLMTIGKGAMLLTDSNSLYAMIKDLRYQGGNRPYKVRFDYTITDYQAAMGLEQLGNLSAIIERRRKIAQVYLEALRHSQLKTAFLGCESDAYGAFPVFSEQSLEHMTRYFQSLNIETRRVYPAGPLHQQLGLPVSDFANTERLYQRGLQIPLYPYLTKMNVERISGALKTFY